MTTKDKIARRKLSLLELASDLDNVSRACKMIGYSRQRFQDPRQRCRIDVVPHQSPVAPAEHNLHLSGRSRGRAVRLYLRCDLYWKDRRQVLHQIPRFAGFNAKLPAPGAKLVGVEVVTLGNFGNRGTVLQALLYNPALLFERP